ncbi:hypothetical protein EV421DRAFT_1737622 [Armillaria borealis]|uniref:Uncharacterized protein n=1 Tax=Armillaria borealis TaxID=47425 RepID=A0AA39JD44_9AGAR|nr:hypothetical protein EV421DRAFT_1737622 [Armillaria borealis]
MRSQKLAFVFLVLNATAVFCAPTADPSSVHELDINARAKGKKTDPSTTSNTKCRLGKSSGTSKPKRDLHARAKSSQTSSTGLTLCGVKAQIAKPGVCKYKPFDGSEEETDSSAQNSRWTTEWTNQGPRQNKTGGYPVLRRAPLQVPVTQILLNLIPEIYAPLSRTNTQISRLKAQLTASKADAKGQGQICDYTVDITVLDRTAFENLACPSFDALAGIIEKSKAEQLKLKEEWLKPTIMFMNKPSLNMWYIQKELFLSKIDKTIEALSGLGTTAISGSSSQAEDNGSENENTESVSVQQYLTDAKVKAEIDAFATKFAGSITSAFTKAVKEAQACATSAEKKKITKIQAQLNQKGGLRKLIPAGIQHYTDTIAGEEEPQEDTQDPQEEDPQDPQDPNQDVASDETASPTGPSSNPTESDSGSNGIDGPGSHGASGAPGSGSEESGGGVEETGMGEGSDGWKQWGLSSSGESSSSGTGEEDEEEPQEIGNNGGLSSSA